MAVLRLRDKDGNIIQIPAIKGEKGDTGDVPASRSINGHTLEKDITLTASDIGAAPTGYGLGNAKKVEGLSGLNAFTGTGWFYGNDAIEIDGIKSSYWFGHTEAYNDGTHHCVQELYLVSGKIYGPLIRHKYQGDFGDWEWVNPVLTASDVGAVPATRKVNNQALSADILLTASDVGAAPSGYGLGKAEKVDWGLGLNTFTRPGWFYGNDSIDIDGMKSSYWFGRTDAYTDGSNHCVQTLYLVSGEIYGPLIRRMHQGTFGDWEWVNPPMKMGMEYRTTERYKNKVVYTKCIDCGTISDATKQITHNIAIKNIVKVNGVIANENVSTNDDKQYTLPAYAYGGDAFVRVFASEKAVYIEQDTLETFAGWNCQVQLWYTKD